MVGTVHVALAGAGRAAHVDTRPDLPKHAFGSCAICTARLRAAQHEAPVAARRTRNAAALPTRLLVQTSPVAGLDHEGGCS